MALPGWRVDGLFAHSYAWLESYSCAHKNVPGFMKNLYLSFFITPLKTSRQVG